MTDHESLPPDPTSPAKRELARIEREVRHGLIKIALVLAILAAWLFLALRCDAAPKRHASAYVYSRGKPIDPLDRSQKIARELLAPAAGHRGPGLMEPVVILDLLATDRPDRILWPHAAGVDTVWFGELPEPAAGERSYVVVGLVGRGIPDSVRVQCAAESFSLVVRRKR